MTMSQLIQGKANHKMLSFECFIGSQIRISFLRNARHFWIPDIFIDQAKQVRDPSYFVTPASLRIYRLKVSVKIRYLVQPWKILFFIGLL